MTPSPEMMAELVAGVEALYNQELGPEQAKRLERILADNPAARREYVRLTTFFVNLQSCAATLLSQADTTSVATADGPDDMAAAAAPFSAPLFSLSPLVSSGWPLAYLVATAIFAIALAVGALVHVSKPEPNVASTNSAGHPSSRSPLPNSSAIIARITGMADCVWEGTGGAGQGSGPANHKSESRDHDPLLHLGDRLAVKSGLLEITYDTGAKVILQGPIAYEVESAAGGHLLLGKLTVRLDGHPAIPNQKSEIINQKFSIRTPTALVTDLGTEFGVEVDHKGNTRSHVFRGSVQLQATLSDGTAQRSARVLSANESALIERRDSHTNVAPIILMQPPAPPKGFVRKLPKQTVRMLDLVDVVAGGDGFSGRRNRGIDSLTGQIAYGPPSLDKMISDGQYHRTTGLPFIDGVFVPNGANGPVQTDSAGHLSKDFGKTSAETSHVVWAGGPVPTRASESVRTVLGGVDFASPGHGLLFMQSNKAITFNLDAIRRANPDYTVLRFRATAGNAEPASENGIPVSADVRVLVDGRVRFKRREVSNYTGAMSVLVSIRSNDRFLTLAATDAGNSIFWDWILFGDPRLELAPTGVRDTANTAP